MNIETAIAGVLQEKSALQQQEGLSNPSYISEHMQALSQYVSALDDSVREEERRLDVHEAKLFKEYRAEKKTVNASQTQIKYDMMADRAEIKSLSKLVSGSWKFINACQSRLKHLTEEAKNQL